MKVCVRCSQNCMDTETVCQRCGSNQFKYYNSQRSIAKTQSLDGQNPQMVNQAEKSQTTQRQMMGQRPQMMRAMQSTNQPIGQKPQTQIRQPNGQPNEQPNEQPNGQPNGQAHQIQTGQSQNTKQSRISVPLTQVKDGDLPPRPNVDNLPPKEAKKVLKEWQKRVDIQAKSNRKLVKQQQKAAKQVEKLEAKGKPVPEKLKYLASGALIEEANIRARNDITQVRGQNINNNNFEAQRNEQHIDNAKIDIVTVNEWFIHTLKTIIPIYGIIYIIRAAFNKIDIKPSLKEQGKFQFIIIIASLVIQIAQALIAQIVISNMW